MGVDVRTFGSLLNLLFNFGVLSDNTGIVYEVISKFFELFLSGNWGWEIFDVGGGGGGGGGGGDGGDGGDWVGDVEVVGFIDWALVDFIWGVNSIFSCGYVLTAEESEKKLIF